MSRYKHGNFAGFPQCTSNNGIRHRLQVVACGVEISRFKDDPPGRSFHFLQREDRTTHWIFPPF